MMFAKQLSVGNGEAVSPDDGTTFAQPTRALWVGSAGNVAVEFENGGEETLVGVQAGTMLPIRVVKVKSTGTTAGSIVALYDN